MFVIGHNSRPSAKSLFTENWLFSRYSTKLTYSTTIALTNKLLLNKKLANYIVNKNLIDMCQLQE